MSWVHYADFIAAVAWLIDRDDMSGVVNIAAPHPLPNEKFMRLLRAAYGRSFGLPATNWMIEVGTFLLRTESELILKSRRVVPGRLLDKGFEFRFPDWQRAAIDLCQQYRDRATADPEVRQAYADVRGRRRPDNRGDLPWRSRFRQDGSASDSNQ
jgi:NAD dependent epimerase/dehydratase family enzyme